jgi:peptidoglycan/xylan/chitin deacetylase (PgdA/CDA1 family)
LIAERVPCTYFVTVKNVLDGIPFPHDVARGRRLAPNTLDELKSLAQAGIEIGCHTRTHADLGQVHDRGRLMDEVVTAGEELQAALGRPVRYFAFPYGQHANLNVDAFHLAYEAGYEAVCSAYGGLNFPGDDAFHLQRVPADLSMIRMKNWLSVDPRKRGLPRFEYERNVPTRRPQGASRT